jgi:hypothetical protein
VLHAGVVDEVSGGEIVGAVEHDVAALDETFDVRVVDVDDFRLDLDVGVDLADASGGGHRLRRALARVAFGVERLALEVGFLHKVAVGDAQGAHAGAREHLDLRGA